MQPQWFSSVYHKRGSERSEAGIKSENTSRPLGPQRRAASVAGTVEGALFNPRLVTGRPSRPLQSLLINNGKIPLGGDHFLSTCVIVSCQDAGESVSRQLFPRNIRGLVQTSPRVLFVWWNCARWCIFSSSLLHEGQWGCYEKFSQLGLWRCI